jgi:hypothetical protein
MEDFGPIDELYQRKEKDITPYLLLGAFCCTIFVWIIMQNRQEKNNSF